jgi:tetratricopeptide (TPR) repeat protein
MLHKRLEEASKNAKRNRMLVVAFIVGGAIFGGISIFGATMYMEVRDLRSQLAAPKDTSHELDNNSSIVAPTPRAVFRQNKSDQLDVSPEQRQDAPRAMPLPKPFDVTRPSPRQTQEPLLPKELEPPVTSSLNTSPETTNGTEEKRQAFKKALKFFATELEPEIASEPYKKWAMETQKDVIFLKNAAVSAFSSGDFDKALESIGNATALADKSLKKKKAAFEAARMSAQQALDQDNVEIAETEVARAAALDPSFPGLVDLQNKIVALPKVLQHLKAAEVARVENNLQREHDQLKQALGLDPARIELRDRMSALAATIKENTFSNHIWSGNEYVTKRRLSAAQKSVTAARRIFPKREEVAILAAQVAALDKMVKTQKSLGRASVASVRDDWQTALQAYKEARNIQPTNAEAINGEKLATTVIDLTAEIRVHLDAPQRLASKNVAELARKLVVGARQIKGKSATLDAKASELDLQLKTFEVKVPIVVLSDGVSYITVKGVGRVGTMKEKTIHLKPGDYTFESTRSGFRSKLVSVSIPPSGSPFTVEIFCDERI